MKINKILIIMLAFFAMIGTAFSAAGTLNVVLASQNPDPVTPGNFVFVNVKISNSGTGSNENVIINLLENEFFTIAPGDDISKDLGVIPEYSSATTSNNYVIAKFKVQVSNDAPTGLNTVNFEVLSGILKYNYNFDILVQDNNPDLAISSLNINPIAAGGNEKLMLEIENPNSIDLKNVVVSLSLDLVTPTNSLSTLTGSNQKTIALIKANEKVKLEFDLAASPSADSLPYILPININYEDSLSNQFNKTILSSIKVFSESLFTLKLASQDIYSIGSAKINLAIANPGTSTIKGVQVEILDSSEYNVLSGAFEYIGNLNPDDFQTIQSQIYLNSDKNFNLKIKVNYLDSYNNKNEKIIEVPITIYTSDELKTFGLNGATNSKSSATTTIVTLILIGIAFYIGRKFGIKKAKSNKK